MTKALLVTIDVPLGAKIIEALDHSDLSISVALWAYLSDYEDWRLVLASRKLDEVNLSKASGLVDAALQAAGISYEQTPTLAIRKMSDPFIRDLRRMFGKAKSVEGMRLGGQLSGDRFIEDAIVYRIR